MTPDTYAVGPLDQGERPQAKPGLYCLIRPERATGKSFDWSRRNALLAQGQFEIDDRLPQGIGPAGRPMAASSLVRRLVLAKHDQAKQRIRAWLSNIDDERLFCFGLTPEDITALRGTASAPAEPSIAQALDAPSEDGHASSAVLKK